MPLIEVTERTAMVRVLARLEAAPVVSFRDRDGGLVPDQIMITYSSLVGGPSWSAQALFQGTRTHPRPGQERELSAVFGEELHMPDWVYTFVELNEPDAALRGGS